MHIPVLERELIDFLEPQRGDNFIDCTLGEGGHAEAVLKRTALKGSDMSRGGKLIGIEWDETLIRLTQRRLEKYGRRLILVNDNYSNLKRIVKRLNSSLSFKGIYFDLGACLWHYKRAKRGFSFRETEFLDMRFSQERNIKAFEIINQWSGAEIERILRSYGEIETAKKIAVAIVARRKKRAIRTTKDLASLIRKNVSSAFRAKEKQIIRKAFQALRIAVNQELENLERGLLEASDILKPQGKIAVIAYHSLEDRITKRFFEHHPQLSVLTKKPVVPGVLERRFNLSARSAKLRVAVKLKINNCLPAGRQEN